MSSSKLDPKDLKKKLTPEQYHITQEKGTEPAFTGQHLYNKKPGMYKCVACGAELFESGTKFDSGTGWPSFTDPKNLEAVELRPDNSLGMQRTEVACKNCGAHLGHVFDDGPAEMDGKPASGQRYCINSCALDFSEHESKNSEAT